MNASHAKQLRDLLGRTSKRKEELLAVSGCFKMLFISA